MNRIICIDGNIGAGKSTLLSKLSQIGYKVFYENHSDWMWALEKCSEEGFDRWSCTLQIAVLKSMALQKQAIDKITTTKSSVIIIERCPSSSMIFTDLSANNMLCREYDLVFSMYKLLHWEPSTMMILNTPPAECFERIKSRGRKCEANITHSYLEKIDQMYRDRYPSNVFVDYRGTIDEIADRIINILKI